MQAIFTYSYEPAWAVMTNKLLEYFGVVFRETLGRLLFYLMLYLFHIVLFCFNIMI